MFDDPSCARYQAFVGLQEQFELLQAVALAEAVALGDEGHQQAALADHVGDVLGDARAVVHQQGLAGLVQG
ncbi:hypothetical protein D3C78_1475770 [compost metagenome]